MKDQLVSVIVVSVMMIILVEGSNMLKLLKSLCTQHRKSLWGR